MYQRIIIFRAKKMYRWYISGEKDVSTIFFWGGEKYVLYWANIF